MKAFYPVYAAVLALSLAACTKSTPDSGSAPGASKSDVKEAPSRVDGKMVLLRGNGAEPSDLDPQIARRLWRQIIDEACALEEAHMGAR